MIDCTKILRDTLKYKKTKRLSFCQGSEKLTPYIKIVFCFKLEKRAFTRSCLDKKSLSGLIGCVENIVHNAAAAIHLDKNRSQGIFLQYTHANTVLPSTHLSIHL